MSEKDTHRRCELRGPVLPVAVRAWCPEWVRPGRQQVCRSCRGRVCLCLGVCVLHNQANRPCFPLLPARPFASWGRAGSQLKSGCRGCRLVNALNCFLPEQGQVQCQRAGMHPPFLRHRFSLLQVNMFPVSPMGHLNRAPSIARQCWWKLLLQGAVPQIPLQNSESSGQRGAGQRALETPLESLFILQAFCREDLARVHLVMLEHRSFWNLPFVLGKCCLWWSDLMRCSSCTYNLSHFARAHP